MKRVLFGVLLSIAALFTMSGTVFAHVTIKPAEVQTASFQTFTVSVPNERDVAVSSITLQIPADLNYVTPTVKPGWSVAIQKSGENDAAKVVALTWSGGSVDAGFRDDFSFSAQVPTATGELQWKAIQTYTDGVTVTWDQDPAAEGDHESETSGPYSVTQVVSETQTATALGTATDTAESAKSTATWALYVAIASAIIALIAVYLSSKK